VLVLLRFFFKSVILGFVVKILGRFFPSVLRLLRLWR
jgi:hypothetical protein